MSKQEVCQNNDEQAFEDLINKIKGSPPFDAKSQGIRSVKDLAVKIRQMSHSMERQCIAGEQRDDRIVKLSEISKEIHSELLKHFEEWKTEREKLIQTLKSTSETLERNATFVSGFKILTSVIDIVANLGEIPDSILGSGNSWTRLAVNNVSLLGVVALISETGYNSKIISNIRKAILKEQKSFDKIIEWYEKTKELDEVIESFFPYVIDTDIAKIINNRFSDTEDYEKIFTTIMACNGKQNTGLFDNKKFLKVVYHIATSESGKLWYYKTILQSVPDAKSFKNSRPQEKIPRVLKAHQTEDREIFLEVLRSFSSKVNVKIAFDVMSIISRSCSILYGSAYEVSKAIENFEKHSEEKFKNIEYIIRLLEPMERESNSQDDISESKKLC